MTANTPRQPSRVRAHEAPAESSTPPVEPVPEHDNSRPSAPTRSTAIRDCRYRTRAGGPCPFKAAHDDGGCASHSQSPEALAERRARSVKGGVNHSNVARAVKIVAAGPYADLADVLQRAAGEVYSGTLDPQRGSALAQLARGIVLVADAALVGDRLEALEAEVANLRTGNVAGETFSSPALVR